ncbi:hypothetical protein VCHA53O473_70049 [Vibrio chagasii]|nr:hypothetical protein VCHA53O473_70049 [Vibrio chagasii]
MWYATQALRVDYYLENQKWLRVYLARVSFMAMRLCLRASLIEMDCLNWHVNMEELLVLVHKTHKTKSTQNL